MAKFRKSKNHLAFRPDFGFGDLEKIVAERDEMLAHYYVGHDLFFARAYNREDDASVFIGPKGVGKSALLQMIRLQEQACGNSHRLIEIAPDDLAFNAIVNIQERSPLLQSPGENHWLFKSLWDYVLCVALLEREHGNPSAIAQAIKNLFGNRHEKEQQRLLKAALNDTGETKSMTEKMLALVEEIEVHGTFAGSGGGLKVKTRGEQADPIASSDLNTLQLINNVAKNLPQQLKHEYFVLIDDLDLHWKGTDIQNAFLGSLFFSIRKLSFSKCLKFVVSLRKQIFREVDLEERDKFSPFVCEMHWRPELVREMTERRLVHALNVQENEVWGGLFPSDGFETLFDCTDGNPREAIRLSAECVKEAIASGHYRVESQDMDRAITSFSQARLDDLSSDLMYTLPGLKNVTRQFAGGRKEFDIEYLRERAFALAPQDLEDRENTIAWAAAGFEVPLEFARKLVGAGFLLVKEGRDAKAHAISQEDLGSIDDSFWYAIHPMYHAGLELEGTRSN